MSGYDGHECPAGSPDCGYVGGGDSDEDRQADWEHMLWEHRECNECGARPRGGDSVTHSPKCARLRPGYRYPPRDVTEDPMPAFGDSITNWDAMGHGGTS